MHTVDHLAEDKLSAGETEDEGADHERSRDVPGLRPNIRTSRACCHCPRRFRVLRMAAPLRRMGRKTVQTMLGDLKLDPVDVDSCAVGVQSKTGEPILKPWRIAVSSPLMRKALDDLRCQGGHTHVPCSGDEKARFAFYPEHLCNAIHDGLGAHKFASGDKCVGGGCAANLEGGCVATLEGKIVDPVVERA